MDLAMMAIDESKKNQFVNEILLLKKNAAKDISQDDFFHLKKVIFINRILLLIGYATIWTTINPLSMVCISIAMHNQWTIVAHHVLHGGYMKVPNIPKRYNWEYFSMGWRRWIDWFDWIYPAAWKYEHNTLHHFYTNEILDPDMIFYRVNYLFDRKYPTWIKFIVMFMVMCIWKAFYYSKNTLKAFYEKKNYAYLKSFSKYAKKSYLYNYIPYIGFYFLLLPLLFLPLSFVTSFDCWKIFIFVFINRFGAEILTNIHSFCTIVPNHLGDDISLQANHFNSKADFFINQINSTCNFNTGGFIRDYLHGYMNYQIEHHLFPELPPLQYVKLQPKVKALCVKYGIIYRQEHIFIRVKKAIRILIGLDVMKNFPDYPRKKCVDDATITEAIVPNLDM